MAMASYSFPLHLYCVVKSGLTGSGRAGWNLVVGTWIAIDDGLSDGLRWRVVSAQAPVDSAAPDRPPRDAGWARVRYSGRPAVPPGSLCLLLIARQDAECASCEGNVLMLTG